MRTSKLVLFLIIGLLLFVLVAVAALLLVDPAIFRGQLEARAAAALGRQVQFDGPISLERSLRPRIVIEDITIGNPAWASGEHFTKVEKIGVQVALFPLLRGDLTVLDVLFTGVEVFIEEGPDGANNYTFGDSGASQEPRGLPSIEQLLIRDAIIYYRSADASMSRYEIAEARLWNIPGQPERIEAEGFARGMPYTILLVAGTPAELSGPQNPWSVRLDMQVPDMSLTIDGRMAEAFVWDEFDYRIAISGNQVDSLEKLFDLEFPTTGPFEMSAAVNAVGGLYSVKDFIAHVQGAPGTPDIKITEGEASGGQDNPLLIELQGKYGDAPLAFTFKSERTFEVSSQTTPWPLEARLHIADTKFDVLGTITLATNGETLHALLEQAAITLQIRPANVSYTGKIGAQKVDVTFESAEFIARKDRPVTATFTGTLQSVPFNATVSTVSLAGMRTIDAVLPVRIALQTPDVQFKAEGTIGRPFEKKEFDLKHEITGKEIEGLAPLIDLAVPLRGEFRAKGTVSARGNRFTYEEDLRVGKTDLKANITVVRQSPRPKITASIFTRELHLDDVKLFYADEDSGPAEDTSRVIPDYTIPIDAFSAADLYLDIKAERILTGIGDLGDLVSKVRLKDGRFKSSLSITGFTGGQISKEFDLNGAANPPLNQIQLNAKDLNYWHLLRSMELTDLLLPENMELTDLIEGHVDLYVDLSGAGATRRSFLGNADGRITIITGSGKITGRMLDLWAADLIPTMLSPWWQRQEATDMNCMVAHIELKDGLAEIEDILLDTKRVTIAGSGIVDLETEELDVFLAPRPKQPSLVSLANPVEITGTLSQPEVSAVILPRQRKRRLAVVGILATLINPAFLIVSFSDIGTGMANPCVSAVERAHQVIEDNPR